MDFIKNLLNSSKISKEKSIIYKLTLENNLEEAVNVIVDELKLLAKEKQLKIVVNTSPDEATGFFDWEKMLQVIRNLLSNAIKFTPEHKKIIISVCITKESFLKFTISDQGIGIPENELEEVFDSFVQSSKTRTKAGGTGLGLSISKEIIKEHGGSISASINEDYGADFTFVIPRSRDNQE